MLKLIGLSLILTASSAMGLGLARTVRRQQAQTLALIDALLRIRHELQYRLTPLPEIFAALGSSLAVSDAGTGAVFAWAAMYGAALNVLANTRLMADRERAEDMNRSVNKLMQEYRVRADRVYGDIFAKLSDK